MPEQVLDSLISSILIDDVCPRVLLGGRLCLLDTGFGCICEYVSGATMEPVVDDNGKATAWKLTTVVKRGSSALDIENQLDMTGLKACHAGTAKVVESVFDLKYPQNMDLKSLSAVEVSQSVLGASYECS